MMRKRQRNKPQSSCLWLRASELSRNVGCQDIHVFVNFWILNIMDTTFHGGSGDTLQRNPIQTDLMTNEPSVTRGEPCLQRWLHLGIQNCFSVLDFYLPFFCSLVLLSPAPYLCCHSYIALFFWFLNTLSWDGCRTLPLLFLLPESFSPRLASFKCLLAREVFPDHVISKQSLSLSSLSLSLTHTHTHPSLNPYPPCPDFISVITFITIFVYASSN
jgi:hypothetical protein